MATFYEGTPLSEFMCMPVDELMRAQDHAERIEEQRKKEIEKNRRRR